MKKALRLEKLLTSLSQVSTGALTEGLSGTQGKDMSGLWYYNNLETVVMMFVKNIAQPLIRKKFFV